MTLIATIGGILFGGFVGFVFVVALGLSKSVYRSKRECRECRARMAEYGFHVGYKNYKCVEESEAGK